MTTQITTHIADAKERLLFQYKGKANIEALLDSLGGQQIQDLENILFDINTRLDIDNSEGVQLNNIGLIVGQPRNGQDDITYRLFLKAKAGVNVSEGDVERVLSVWKIITGGSVIQVIDVYPAGVELFSDVPVADELAEAAFTLMQDVVAAGVRVTSSIISPEDAFGFDSSVGTLGFDDLFAQGDNTSVAAFKLIDTGANFGPDGTIIGSEVIEVVGNVKALVTNIDSTIQLTLDTDIFTSTPLAYEVIDGGGGGLSKIQSA
jgi:hypothetical protein